MARTPRLVELPLELPVTCVAAGGRHSLFVLGNGDVHWLLSATAASTGYCSSGEC